MTKVRGGISNRGSQKINIKRQTLGVLQKEFKNVRDTYVVMWDYEMNCVRRRRSQGIY